MSQAATQLTIAPPAPAPAPRTLVWRPFAREVADIIVVQDRAEGSQPRMYPWLAISLIRSPSIVTVESRRDVMADRGSVVVLPAFQLHTLRPLGGAAEGAVTLLLGGAHLAGLGLPVDAALVSDPALGDMVAALVAQLQRPVRSVEHAAAVRPLLEHLLACAMSLTGHRERRALAPVRALLHSQVSEAVSIESMARASALSACHLIRTFHLEFGLPPHAYHVRLRLAAACELLARGLPVASVTYECGFADQSHLSRVFKAVYGLTPAAWGAAAAGSPRVATLSAAARGQQLLQEVC